MNPHPTKSKPSKIGRKHTGAISQKTKQKRHNAASKKQKIKQMKAKKFHSQVAEYFAGKREQHP